MQNAANRNGKSKIKIVAKFPIPQIMQISKSPKDQHATQRNINFFCRGLNITFLGLPNFLSLNQFRITSKGNNKVTKIAGKKRINDT